MSRGTAQWRPALKLPTILEALIVAGLIVVAVQETWRATAGLHLPPDPDLYRSAALTQSIADGGWIADPFFAGEWNWYNPLVPLSVAALHAVTGMPILDLYARGGVVLNLLGPLAFWALVRVLFGSGAAVAAMFTFLFLPPREIPGYATAGYWPWLFSSAFTQGVFYLGLIGVDSAGRSMRLGQWLLAGAALGLVFLGHTAPALILGAVVVLAAARMWRAGCPAGRSLLLLAGCLLAAIVVSFPLVLSVAGRYRFAVENDILAIYALPLTEPGNFREFIGLHANAGGALAVLGTVLLAFDRERLRRVWVIRYWGAVNGLLLLLHYGRNPLASAGLRIPQVVTAFHFFLYAEAIVAILGGYALWRIVDAAARPLPRAAAWMTRAAVARVLLLTIVALSVRPTLANRRAREDFDESRQRAVRYQRLPGDQSARDWIRTHTMPGTVFLASGELALYVVAPSGGKVVALDAVFANPYVDVAAREADQLTMFDRIHENDRTGYCAAAQKYTVRYVITDSKRGEERLVPDGTFLEELRAAEGIRIFRAPDCGTGTRPQVRHGEPGHARSLRTMRSKSPIVRTVRNDVRMY